FEFRVDRVVSGAGRALRLWTERPEHALPDQWVVEQCTVTQAARPREPGAQLQIAQGLTRGWQQRLFGSHDRIVGSHQSQHLAAIRAEERGPALEARLLLGIAPA